MASGFANVRAFFEKLVGGDGGDGPSQKPKKPQQKPQKLERGKSLVVNEKAGAAEGRNILELLDDGMLIAILLNCDLRGLWALNLTCRAFHELLAEPSFWERRIQLHFPDVPADVLASYSDGQQKNLYLSLLRPKVHAASSGMTVIWLDGNYLRRQADPESDANEVVVLSSVCWLEMKGELKKVLKGAYKAVWRLRVEENAVLDNVTFSVDVPKEAGSGCVRRWKPAEYGACGGKGWMDLEVGRLEVTVPSTVVSFSLRSTEQMWWKSGLSVDYFRIVPSA